MKTEEELTEVVALMQTEKTETLIETEKHLFTSVYLNAYEFKFS